MPEYVRSPRAGAPRPGGGAGSGTALSQARAPYNFVPLPEQVLPVDEPPPGDRYHDHDAAGRYSGHLDLTIETETPLYLRGTVSAERLADDTPSPDFFAPTGRPAIPGSSLRGMLRTLVEIVSSSALLTETGSDKRFAFRAVADAQSALGSEYRKRLLPVFAGYLRRTTRGLEVQPAARLLGQPFCQVDFAVASQALGWNTEEQPFKRQRIHFLPTDEKCGARSQYCCVRQLIDAGKPRPTEWASGQLVVSGHIENKKHAWIVGEPAVAARPLPVSPDVARDYESHWSEALKTVHKTGQFPLLPGVDEPIPCFYTTAQRDGMQHVSAIGHTRWFRAVHRHEVGHAVPSALRLDVAEWDLAHALFGRAGDDAESWAGRIFVEDALLEGPVADALLPVARRQILATPQLTTVQHYLEQPGGNAATLRHWDSADARVRGHKLYWHRRGVAWKAEESGQPALAANTNTSADERRLQAEPIQPVAAQQRFRGRLRFENLSAFELGALLFVLQLPPDCRHRLGQGKPLGLGSVRLDAKLHIDDRRARYRQLFTTTETGTFNWAEPERSVDGDGFRRAFARWAVPANGANPQPSTADDPVAAAWEQPRLRALRALLTWDTAPPTAKTSYMQLEQFSGRPILPDAITVIGWPKPPAGLAPALPPSGPRSPSPTAAPSQAPPPRSVAPNATQGAGRGQQPSQPAASAPQPAAGRPAASPGEAAEGAATLEDLQRRFARPTEQARPPKQPARADERAKREQERIMRRMRGAPPEKGDGQA